MFCFIKVKVSAIAFYESALPVYLFLVTWKERELGYLTWSETEHLGPAFLATGPSPHLINPALARTYTHVSDQYKTYQSCPE